MLSIPVCWPRLASDEGAGDQPAELAPPHVHLVEPGTLDGSKGKGLDRPWIALADPWRGAAILVGIKRQHRRRQVCPWVTPGQTGALGRCLLTPSARCLVSPPGARSLIRHAPASSTQEPVEPSGPRPLHHRLAEWAELGWCAAFSAKQAWPAGCRGLADNLPWPALASPCERRPVLAAAAN